jgi:hypothetical protein
MIKTSISDDAVNFYFDVHSIEHINNKYNELESICKSNNYFDNKYDVNWNTINSICIIAHKITPEILNFSSIMPYKISLSECTMGEKNSIKKMANLIKKSTSDIVMLCDIVGILLDNKEETDDMKLFDLIKSTPSPLFLLSIVMVSYFFKIFVDSFDSMDNLITRINQNKTKK